jgi:hypothetical protein
VNEAFVTPAGIITLGATVTAGELELSATTVPAVPAAAVRVTLHEDCAPGPIEAGLHARTPTAIGPAVGIVMVPPVAVTAMDDPLADAPSALPTPILVVLAAGANTALTTATCPLAIVPASTP